MIEGLQVTVDGKELILLCKDRVIHHLERAEKYLKQIVSMKESAIEGMAYTNGDPIRPLEDKRASHEAEAAEMEFIANHLVAAETYLLGRDDLVKLGITKSRY
jgi:hypothetical protein